MTGEELRRLRTERLRLTQRGLAERLGVTITCVARWERNERGIAELAARFIQLLADLERRPRRRR